jgi:hypothetical protein
MRKYITLFFLVTVILSSCNDKSDNSVIKHDEMVNVLTDMLIVDGSMYNTPSQNPDTLYKYGTGRYLALFKRHHIDSVQFRTSLKYYANKPVELQAMYDKILDNLKARTDSINKAILKQNKQQNVRGPE